MNFHTFLPKVLNDTKGRIRNPAHWKNMVEEVVADIVASEPWLMVTTDVEVLDSDDATVESTSF